MVPKNSNNKQTNKELSSRHLMKVQQPETNRNVVFLKRNKC